jgi:hypothetical protein
MSPATKCRDRDRDHDHDRGLCLCCGLRYEPVQP